MIDNTTHIRWHTGVDKVEENSNRDWNNLVSNNLTIDFISIHPSVRFLKIEPELSEYQECPESCKVCGGRN